MSVTDELLANHERYAASFDKGALPLPPAKKVAVDEDVRQSIARIKASPFIPNQDSVRGFVYEVESGTLREVDAS